MTIVLVILIIGAAATGWVGFYLQERITEKHREVIDRQTEVINKLRNNFTTVEQQFDRCHRGAQEMVGLYKQLMTALDKAAVTNFSLRVRIEELEQQNQNDPADYWKHIDDSE